MRTLSSRNQRTWLEDLDGDHTHVDTCPCRWRWWCWVLLVSQGWGVVETQCTGFAAHIGRPWRSRTYRDGFSKRDPVVIGYNIQTLPRAVRQPALEVLPILTLTLPRAPRAKRRSTCNAPESRTTAAAAAQASGACTSREAGTTEGRGREPAVLGPSTFKRTSEDPNLPLLLFKGNTSHADFLGHRTQQIHA